MWYCIYFNKVGGWKGEDGKPSIPIGLNLGGSGGNAGFGIYAKIGACASVFYKNARKNEKK